MVIAVYVAPQNERAYLRQRAREVRHALAKFPITKQFAADISKLARRHTHTIQNPLFWMTGRSPIFGIDAWKSNLSELETAFRVFRARQWPRNLQREISSRICSAEAVACASILSEMDVALTLKRRFGKTVKLYPMYPKKGPDIVALVRGRPICFEVTSVGVGKTEDKLVKICRGLAKELYGRMKDSSVLHAEIDTTKLVWSNKGHLSVKKSIRKAVYLLDKLSLPSLFAAFAGFDLEDVASLGGMDEDSVVSYLTDHNQNEKGYASPEFRMFLSKASQDDMINSPIRSFIRVRGRHRLAEIASRMFFPSAASQAEQYAFLRRVEIAVAAKILGGQLQSDFPNIVALRASNWTLPNYEDASPADPDWFKPLKDHVRLAANASRSPKLSAVMFFENKFKNAWIVGNRFAGPKSRLTTPEYCDLFGKHRIREIERVRISLSLKKKIIPEKVLLCASSIKRGYETTSKIKIVCVRREYDELKDSHRRFVQCPRYIVVPKNVLRDPSSHPDFSETGRTIAFIEEDYLITEILENSETRPKLSMGYDLLCDEIDSFRAKVGEPSTLFLPLELYSEVHRWVDVKRRRSCFTYVDGQMRLVLKHGAEIPIHWLKKRVPDDHVIIYRKQSHGEWIFKPGNLTDTLTFELRRNQKDKAKVNLLAKTVASYDAFDTKGAWKLRVITAS